MTPSLKDIARTVVQSYLIHPDWDMDMHIHYLINDAFLIEPEEDTPILRAFLSHVIEEVKHS
jgi:hypothetical protein